MPSSSNNDIYDSQLRSIFWLQWQGFDGVGGPCVSGTGYYIKRLSLCSNSIHEGVFLCILFFLDRLGNCSCS
ncbi:unnamed protein product [Prunus brigantina]